MTTIAAIFTSKGIDGLLQMLVADQKECGEFGRTRDLQVQILARGYQRIERHIEKPNTFLTVIALEILSRANPKRYAAIITRGLEWLHSKIVDGEFRSLALRQSDPVSTYDPAIDTKVENIRVYRHAAEALECFCSLEPPDPVHWTLAKKLLVAQREDGGWPSSERSNESHLLATAYVVSALRALYLNATLSFSTQLIASREDVWRAISTGMSWMRSRWESDRAWFRPDFTSDRKNMATATVMFRLATTLESVDRALGKSVVEWLETQDSGGAWKAGGQLNFETTVRVVAALQRASRAGFNIQQERLSAAVCYLLSELNHREKVDPVTLALIVEAIFKEPAPRGEHADIEIQAIATRSAIGTERFRTWAGSAYSTLAVVFTDIVGSAKIANEVGDEAMEAIRQAHFRQVRGLIQDHGGYEIKTIGDSFMVGFRTAATALDFALHVHAHPGHDRVAVRAGIHVGPVTITEEDAFGVTVTYAARVIAMANGAEVWTSDDVKRHIETERAQRHVSLKWKGHSECQLKGFKDRQVLWSVEL